MAKEKSKLLALITIALLFAYGLRAQSIYFNYADGTNGSHNLEDVRKITFDSDVMNLFLWDGSVFTWNVSTVGNYMYDVSSLNVEELLSNANAWQVTVFPNPVSNTLHIQFNLQKEDNVSIALYDMQGKLMMEKKPGKQASGIHQDTLDLKDVPPGIYICRIVGKHNTISKKIIKH